MKGELDQAPLELPVGLEPTTCGLQIRRSTSCSYGSVFPPPMLFPRRNAVVGAWAGGEREVRCPLSRVVGRPGVAPGSFVSPRVGRVIPGLALCPQGTGHICIPVGGLPWLA